MCNVQHGACANAGARLVAHRFRRDQLRFDGLAASLRSRVVVVRVGSRDAVGWHRGGRVRAQVLPRQKTRFAEFFRATRVCRALRAAASVETHSCCALA